MFKLSFPSKRFYPYYLLGGTIVLLTVVIQSITQYSLKKQAESAALLNIAGQQRLIGQQVLTNFYECRLLKCNYADMILGLERLYSTNAALRAGNSNLGLTEDEYIEMQGNFDKLAPSLSYMYNNLNHRNKAQNVSFAEVSMHVNTFVSRMNTIVSQYQKKAEDDIETLRVVELELAALSILIVLLEVIFIINPSIKKISVQNKKLKEIAWHQSHAFNSHIKNIKDLQYVMDIEKNLAHKQELLDCVMNELNDLEEVSNNMVNTLEPINAT
ncbi:hypothetical protein ACFQZJ_09680 [Maribacter chungangensis]|uniref:NarX-like N-terminal domain-containing protein n=1 Tax=Maribacter chungangensis TaxID=1069117 RepID=A0ABW3B4G7_9FLAO